MSILGSVSVAIGKMLRVQLPLPLPPLLLLATILVTDLPMGSGQRLVGTIYGVNNAGLLNVYQHSSGGPLTKYVLVELTSAVARLRTVRNIEILIGSCWHSPRLGTRSIFF